MKIESLHVYPVAGFRGEEVVQLDFSAEAIRFNKVFTLVTQQQLQRWLKKPELGYPLRVTQTAVPELVLFSARNAEGLLELRYGDQVLPTGLPVELALPEQEYLRSPDQLGIMPSELTAEQLRHFIWPLRVASKSQSIRWASDCGDEVASWISERLGKEVRLFRAVKSPETAKHHFTWYTDIHLIAQASVRALATTLAEPLTIDPFRANVVVDGEEALAEMTWLQLLIGQSEYLSSACERCGYLAIDQETAERSHQELLKEIVSHQHGNFGVYLKHQTGEQTMRVGDEVQVLKTNS